MDAATIADNWKRDEPILRDLGKKVVSFLQNALYQKEMHPEVSFRTKEIQSIIKKIKRKSQQKQYTYNDLRDKLGVRVICPFLSDLEVVDKIIKSSFNIRKVEKKRENIDFNRLDYQSNHYDVSIDSKYIDFDNEEIVFEIQVRTLNQHAWANSAHILYYKQDIELPDEMKHCIYRLLSLYELADEEFSKVNEYLKKHKKDLVYTLLKKLEGKIYKYASTDFDRDLSIKQMKLILNFFNQEDQRKIETEIESFITDNDSKIQHIFKDNRNRYADITFLTQPEIFVIFWGLSNRSFSSTDNWCFDENELEAIINLWC